MIMTLEERAHWMGSDVARYRRKRAVKLDWPGGPRGICHPALCFDNEPERLLIAHLREADVTAHPRRALFWLAWVFLRDAIRRCPGCLSASAEIKWSHGLHDKPVARVIAYDPETTSLTIAPINNPAADTPDPEPRA